MRYKTRPLFRGDGNLPALARLPSSAGTPELQRSPPVAKFPGRRCDFPDNTLAHAGLAILGPGQVAAGNQSAFVFQAPFVMQELAFGAHITICLGLKNESARGQAMRSGSPA